MPRLARTEQQKRMDEVAYRIDDAANRSSMNRMMLAERASMSTATLSRRMNSPETFTLNELYRVANALNVSLGRLLGGFS